MSQYVEAAERTDESVGLGTGTAGALTPADIQHLTPPRYHDNWP